MIFFEDRLQWLAEFCLLDVTVTAKYIKSPEEYPGLSMQSPIRNPYRGVIQVQRYKGFVINFFKNSP